MRQINTEAYVSALRELTRQGHEVSLPVAGCSMTPFLTDQRDTVYFRQPDTPLAPGDIVFYQRESGQFVMHRICRIRQGMLYLAGDAQSELEGPMSPDRVFARITRVRRKGKLLQPGSFLWNFFAHVWIHMIPLRRGILGLYSCMKFPKH